MKRISKRKILMAVTFINKFLVIKIRKGTRFSKAHILSEIKLYYKIICNRNYINLIPVREVRYLPYLYFNIPQACWCFKFPYRNVGNTISTSLVFANIQRQDLHSPLNFADSNPQARRVEFAKIPE